MSTYVKSWIFNAIWVGFVVLLLVAAGVGTMSDQQSSPLPFIAGFIGYVAMVGLSQHYPKCRKCNEPVNMPYDDGAVTWQGVSMIRPDRPKRECGFCGADLTMDNAP